MDDISWPPRKRPSLKIVPGPRSRPKLNLSEESATDNPDSSETQNSVVDEGALMPENESPPENKTPLATGSSGKPPKKGRRLSFRHIQMTKKKWALLILAILVLLVGGAFGARALYLHFRHVPPEAPQAKVEKTPEPPKPTTEPSKLTGVEVPLEANLRPVTGIMIENSPDARPQSGLKDAGIVYEAVAEGGITRFLALFQEARPAYIGPVRSVRPYYLDFLMPFDAGIAHVGGSPQALADIKSHAVKDLDQFANSGSYTRVSNRFAPHNVYTDFDKMDALNAQKGFTSSSFTSFPRKAEAAAATPTAKSINLAISAALYNVHYDYHAASNSYLRNEGGAVHKDEKTGTPITPKVVVALSMTRGIASDGQHTQYGTTGSGHMYVFQDGLVTEGTWAKPERKSQFTFTDASGQPLKLNPGQTWITIVDNAGKVTFTP